MRPNLPAAAIALPLAIVCLAAAPDAGNGLPEARTQNGVEFMTGGVGESQHQAMLRHADKYDLWVTLTAPDGKYLAGVDVSVRNDAGDEVLSTRVDGPFLLAELAPGTYRVRASETGRRPEIRTVDVPASGQARVFVAMPTISP